MQHYMERNGTEQPYVSEQRVHPLGLAEPSAKHRGLRCRKIGYFITNGKRILRSLKSPQGVEATGCTGQNIQVRCEVVLGADGRRGEAVNNFFRREHSPRSGLASLCLVSSESSQGLFRLGAQELKDTLGQDVIMSCQRLGPCDPQAGPALGCCCLGGAGYPGERLGL